MCTYTNCPESGQGKSLGVPRMEISSSFFKSSSQNKELDKEINNYVMKRPHYYCFIK